MLTPTKLVDRFRAEGLKITPQRELVFRIMHDNRTHPTAEAVFAAAREELPMISLKTVYQVLHDLRDLGEIQLIDLGTGAVRFDPNVDDHDHLVCRSCGHTVDVERVSHNTPSLAVAEAAGFDIDQTEVIFWGRCPDCKTP
jgi:Fur family transcriptional regulator, stress-responsive regulator